MMRDHDHHVTKLCGPSGRLPRLLAIIGPALVLLFGPPALYAQDSLCRQDAARYDALQSFKRTTTPERVAAAYVDAFTSKGADRDAQEVWRRMRDQGISGEAAIDAHVTRYYARRSSKEQEEIRREAAAQIRTMSLIHDLVVAFEKALITTQFVAQTMGEGWRTWNLPEPIEHYVAAVVSAAKEYMASGLNEEQAALRAAVDTRANIERSRGVPRSAITDRNSPCYKGDLILLEVSVRHKALKTTMGTLTEAERVELAARPVRVDPDQLSRLSYYTHLSFGPRDYALDRFAAWQMAASSGKGR